MWRPATGPSNHEPANASSAVVHCRNAVRALERLQKLIVDDPRAAGLPLINALRLLGGAKDRVWRSIWLLEPQVQGGTPLSPTTPPGPADTAG